MISIPYITRLGGVVSLKFRQSYDGGEPKYLMPPGLKTRLYNTLAFDDADRQGCIAITEGEFDAMILDGHCGIPAVAVPGVETWKQHKEWPELFRGYGRVLIFEDGDQPGHDLALRILQDLSGVEGNVLTLGHKDVTDAYLASGPDHIRRLAGVS